VPVTIVARTPGLSGAVLIALRMSLRELAEPSMAIFEVAPLTVMLMMPVPTALVASGRAAVLSLCAAASAVTSTE
jgi:hypothetical protein